MKPSDSVFTATCVAISVGFLGVTLFNLLFGVVYDTDAFGDTLFILAAAWRNLQGLEPVVDFGHFYGGFISQTLGWTMRVFGDGAHVLYVYALLLSSLLMCCATLIFRRDLSIFAYATLLLLVVALMLTRNPLELNSPVIRVVSSHAFFYNRFAQAAIAIVALFVALRQEGSRSELVGGFVAGILVGAVCLTKSSFVVVLPGLFLALLIVQRWAAIAGALAGLVMFALIFDPVLARFTGSLEYALAHVGAGNGVGGLIRKSVQILFYQPIAVTLALCALALAVLAQVRWLTVLSITVFTAAVVAMTATMGGNGWIGQLALPTCGAVAIACAELTRKTGAINVFTTQCLTAILVVGFAGPHFLNAGASAVEGFSKRTAIQIKDGPYHRYLSLPEGSDPSDGPTQYDLFAEGVAVLQDLGDPTTWGIVADSGISFEHALRAKPVTGYPLWQRDTAPELAEGRALSDEIDVVLIAKSTQMDASLLRSKLTDEFRLCRTSDSWSIFVHSRLGLSNCQVD